MIIIPVVSVGAMIMMLSQVMIVVLGVTSIYMSFVSRNKKANKWAAPVALAAQPFWIYSTIYSGLIGMVFICMIYTFLYTVATYRNFFEKESVNV